MNQNYRDLYRHLRDNADDAEKDSSQANDLYPDASHARNISFVWVDGNQVFLNYAYLISGSINVEHDTIRLEFTTHTIEIVGSKLSALFDLLIIHRVKSIGESNPRYQPLNEQEFVVVKLTMFEKGEG